MQDNRSNYEKVKAAAAAVVDHWNEFGHEFGIEEWIDSLDAVLRLAGQPGEQSGAPEQEPRQGLGAVNGSAPTDTERLEWLATHQATLTRGGRMKSRRGGLAVENMEVIWTVEWWAEDGALISQTADGGRPNFRDAIDAAMKAQNVRISDGEESTK